MSWPFLLYGNAGPEWEHGRLWFWGIRMAKRHGLWEQWVQLMKPWHEPYAGVRYVLGRS